MNRIRTLRKIGSTSQKELANAIGVPQSLVRSADILYIHNLMSQIVSHCQKHGRNILNNAKKIRRAQNEIQK